VSDKDTPSLTAEQVLPSFGQSCVPLPVLAGRP